MILVSSIEVIQKLIKKVRDHKKDYFTNFFFDIPKLELWIKLSLIEYEETDETVLFCKKNCGFKNLYFCTTTLEILKRNIALFISNHNDEIFVVDIVVNGTSFLGFKDGFFSNGFYLYTSLVRMSRTSNELSNKVLNTKCISIANKDNGLEVLKLLHKYFDIYAEQLPLIEDINRWVEKKGILIYSDDYTTLQGFLIFELIGQTSYLRYWFVHPDYRDKKIGSALLGSFFKESLNNKRQIFWVIESNINAIKRYEHYGFKKEDLFDYVMINKDITYAEKNY